MRNGEFENTRFHICAYLYLNIRIAYSLYSTYIFNGNTVKLYLLVYMMSDGLYDVGEIEVENIVYVL